MRFVPLWTTVLGLALLAWAAWWAEIALVHGWKGMGWLLDFPISAVFGCWMGGLCAVLPLLDERRPRVDRRRLTKAALGIAAIFAVAFGVARRELLDLFGDTGVALLGMTEPAAARQILFTRIATLCTAAVGPAVLTWIVLRRLSSDVRGRTAPLLALGFGVSLPMGWVLAQVLPEMGARPDVVQTVKLGTPAFVACLLTAATVRAGLRPLASDPRSTEPASP